MLKYIKSSFILKILLSILDEGNKLKLLKYNGVYLNGKKWNGILYNNDNNLSIEIKDGKWKIKELNYKLRFIKEDEYIIEDIKGIIKEWFWKSKRI